MYHSKFEHFGETPVVAQTSVRIRILIRGTKIATGQRSHRPSFEVLVHEKG